MNTKLPNFLVLRIDTATGFHAVGWDSDMPLGRFVHLEVICATTSSVPIQADSEYFDDYRAACRRACELNASLLVKQTEAALAQGWLAVALNLHQSRQAVVPDDFGSLLALAMQTRHRLCANKKPVWCVICKGQVMDVRACEPPRAMEAVEFHVWQHQQLQQMQQYGGEIVKGHLVAKESGLWFCPAS